ncbi:MAG: 3-dehydroquinate dehydratase [Thermoanaerobacteraceae bacterium]|uniref:Shikimate kinase n=1 Tax=Biomaibacter acetigenes TaxID=2316383 RepID=A0A3G2R5S8_9FIRM|nr:shikimate kinase [Biomaibacter acetigenes]AYO30715.1 shikimate kinase [Biomaibacter acetigenes]MDK2878482.1 3-dehydroquinate dehydratase [Thermoanaerobacteraceae bacterium]MDN5302977.1 3-dehydroquinate dehydratase [Thermoanaerobacteraceae bacterium]RKL64235.1 shikimate kinase [Thermoanaerobacteraceae bacterium SP2]
MKKTNIILIGFMATGKTSVGKKTAGILNMDFVDTDLLIEESLGLTVPEIFAKFGENYFREKESQIVQEVANKNNTVVATGGGIVLNPGNMKALGSTGIIFWLKAPVELIYERVKNDGYRPLAYNKSIKDIEDMYKKRYNLYEKYNDFSIDVSGKSVENIAGEIVAYYKNISF